MKKKRKRRSSMKKIILTILTVLWMTIIFMFSNQKSSKSTDYSHSLVKNTIVNVYKIFDHNPTDKKIKNIIGIWDHPVRKLAHFMEYFILGILIFITLKSYNINNIYIMILICFLYAFSDEVHQLFVLGRDGNFKDVLIDTFGSSCSILLLKRIKK